MHMSKCASSLKLDLCVACPCRLLTCVRYLRRYVTLLTSRSYVTYLLLASSYVPADFFVRPVAVASIVLDMMKDPRLKLVRFNRRVNHPIAVDRGYKYNGLNWTQTRALFGLHDASGLYNSYTRTPGYSEMNYVISTALFREEILPRIVNSPLLPERVMQPLVAANHSTFGVFIFDKPWANPLKVNSLTRRQSFTEIPASRS